MPRKAPNLDRDFEIYVDPSCRISEPMKDETLATQVPPSADEAQEPLADGAANDNDIEQPIEDCAAGAAEDSQESPSLDVEAETPGEEAAEDEPASEPEVETKGVEDVPPADTPADEEQASPAPEDAALAPAEEQDDTLAVEDAPAADPSLEPEAAPEAVPESEDQEGGTQEEDTESPEVEAEQQENTVSGESATEPPEVEAAAETQAASDPAVGEADAPEPTEDTDSDAEAEACSHREFTPVDRKASLRTEALIQAAARAVIARIEKRNSGHGAEHQEDNGLDNSLLSTGSQDTYVVPDAAAEAAAVYDEHHTPSRPSSQSQVRHIPSRSTSSDEGGGNSSHNDDDVFSERSARSSVYSLDPHDMDDVKTLHAEENLSRRESFASSSRQSDRVMSGLSAISGLSQYDKDPFVPTSRESRMPFRTPSEIRAMQMSSPTPSVFNGSSPRSSKRHGGGSSGFPTMSRVSSPIASAQYSPKGRSTPPRFKSRKEAPLVLLHVTLLPLRWVWGDVLNSLDALHGKPIDEAGSTFEPSEQLKTLRDSWRQLQDRVGDTVLERGILLPHPQNDYEVLEERLLEALELPLRRRARILECGHYLGPANFMGDEEEESDDDYASQPEGTKEEKRHWCNTCRNEIRYGDLGPGKVFRIKVYASNGLMRAGAWEACWKEMERVDVEVEPIIDSALQNELEKLGTLQLDLEEQRQRQQRELELESEEQKREPTPERDSRTSSRQHRDHSEPEHSRADTPSASNSLVRAATPAASRPVSRLTEPIDTSEERRRRDEERLREIYGDMPPPAQSPPPPPVAASTQLVPAQPLPAPIEQQHHYHPHHPQQQQQQQLFAHSHALMPAPTTTSSTSTSPPPMLTDAHHYHHHHHSPHENTTTTSSTEKRGPPSPSRVLLDENSGFVELLMEAFKVLLRDPKNVAIIVLCVFLVVMMKARGGYLLLQEQGQGQVGVGVVQMSAPAPAGGQVQAQGAYGYQRNGNGDGYHGQMQEPRQEVVMMVGEKAAPPAVDVVVDVSSPLSVETALPAVHVEEVKEEGAPSMAEEVVVVEGQDVLQVPENAEPESAAPTADEASGDDEIPAVDHTDTLAFSPVADILAGGLELPTSIPMEEVPGSVEAEAVEVEQPAEASELPLGNEQSDDASELPREVEDSAAAIEERSDSELAAELEGSVPPASPASETTAEKLDNAEANAAVDEVPSADDEECSAAPTAVPPEPTEPEEPVDSCEAVDSDSDMGVGSSEEFENQEEEEELLPTPSSSTPSSSSSSTVFIPGPFVTERKTVRVFETLTETVRVSVVTETETVSTVVTAVPQTVEETVYETETVRITVSVPVEEQGSSSRKAASGSCGGWF
ncbi:uncharacterized protein B0T15DRAFT_250353 [Chaetomium strumarium]|uniref:Pathway-specific nitrogen regulator n=1 Tax=Chaetomium strumarium TaxID=1170767 RepID=A0AAJ0M0P0_9PEZI|nr:hypothetical protein B0T15DRAFT_250353 [Chaetomium strumarium]